MPNPRRERIITVSGLNGYFQLTEEEQKAFRIEFFFTATNVGQTNYYNYEWYKERTLYGRFKLARGEYTLKERLVQYQNELIYQEEATLNEIVKRLQCQAQKQYEVNKFLVEATIKIAAAANIVTGFGGGGAAFDQIPPQPIGIPGLQVDGCYYNMFPGCAGRVIVMTWYDDDICKDVSGNPLTKDNRGKAPTPAFAGKPPSGTNDNVPPPTYEKDATYRDDPNKPDEPTTILDNPLIPKGQACVNYRVTVRLSGSFFGAGTNQTDILYGAIGKVDLKINPDNSWQLRINYGIGCTQAGKPEAYFGYAGGSAYDPQYAALKCVIVSITPM